MSDNNTAAPLPKAYDANAAESRWYAEWEGHKVFQADSTSDKPPHCIVIPPPNVTGVLHMGHALTMTLQDIITRWKRMSGFEALWVPGTDHAGIATQTVVERHLIKETGKRRKDFPREEFLQHVWNWKEKSETRIIEQLKGLGCSCDWSRQRFTMDDRNNKSVLTMFKKMFDNGLIYRGDYLVNWDPVTQTALADDEVEYEERDSFLWHFNYPLTDGSGQVTIATTRPETMLGDSAVAISPKDERNKHLIGKTVRHPLTEREIPVIGDNFVDPEFGTGIVKITPAHDPNDYQMGFRHDIEFINMMTPDGKINENGGRFAGMTMDEGRAAVVAAMQELGLVDKIEPHANRVGVSYRSKAIIEPYMSKQWFVKMDSFRDVLTKVVDDGRINLIPNNWVNSYHHWIDNLRDWCISRQLWWGHRIPIWYHVDDPERMICFDGEGTPPEVAAEPSKWRQDEDVLDTWFSSALWPFATLGWPENTDDLKKFYPNQLLITGHDILFFWVARMIFAGNYVFDEVPFPTVYLHGLIYGKSYWRVDEEGGIHYLPESERVEYDMGKQTPKDVKSKWEKMSKSKGNVIDPLEISKEYGTDAMRMALCSSATQARQIDLDRRKFEEFKNFANKVWNGARFVLMNLDGDAEKGLSELTAEAFGQGLDESLLTLEDRWLLSTLNRVVADVNKDLENYQFDQAALKAYDFFWKEFCAYYVEIAKPVLFGKAGTPEQRTNKQRLLVIALCNALRLIHPMAPFITEELFQTLKTRIGEVNLSDSADAYTKEAVAALSSPFCAQAAYPTVVSEDDIDSDINNAFDLISRVVYTIRNIRGEMNLPPGTSTDVFVVTQNGSPSGAIVEDNHQIVSALVRTKSVAVSSEEPKAAFACTGVTDDLKIIIPLPEEMIERELKRLEKEQVKLEANIAKLEGQLSNEEFVNKAPEHLIEKQRTLLTQAQQQLHEVRAKLQVHG